ncbi:MAG: RluA family pseudouridine synthase [Kiritimatiellae bacterium]|nr:RluA family pseudouridine synthase [Kiritimatiellia bacterium]
MIENNNETDLDAGATDSSCLTFTVSESGAKGRLDAWLAKRCPELSRVRIQQLIKEGCVTIADRSVKATTTPKPDDVIRVVIPAPTSAIPQPEDIPLDVLYEDSDCIVINKQAGLVVHPAPGHPTGTLVNALLFHCSDLGGVGGVERPGIVHRLDKDTSGVMVVVKNDASMSGFVNLFKTDGIRKEYLAIVHGEPENDKGLLTGIIGRDPSNRKKMAMVEMNGKDAITHYRVMAKMGATTLMHCRIETGRTHQIRVHMGSIGCPVIGDRLYGRLSADKKLPDFPARQMLHARRLSFQHPLTKQKLCIVAPLPADFKSFCSESRLTE